MRGNDGATADGHAGADDRAGLDDGTGLDMRRWIDVGMWRDTGFAGHRSRGRSLRKQETPDQRKSLLRARVNQNGDARGSLAGEFGWTKNSRGLQRLHQGEIALAVDKDKRVLTTFIGRRQCLDRNKGLAGIDKLCAGQIRDFASRIPA
ncbi:hypothetical protein AJ88_04610 [Mesorhizobium amorphae CCBAU 01583]|nr:hypothetical protein AJ88_04610 [Mesorhizobium amorphae CCBAU 01583]